MPRILIVDDEVKLVKKLKKLLENDGYRIETASNGLEALDIINKPTQIDVIISDIRMEKMDGLTFLKEIQQKNLDLGVIMITGYGNMDTYLDSVYFGAFEYMQKPVNYEVLLKTINRLLHDKKRKRKKVRSHPKERK
ncbi:MAG: response regulator [Nitrospiraceae bacterium]|nr:response regulator [Nitrospiraceae bacterium]